MLRFRYSVFCGLLFGLGFGIYGYTIGDTSVGLVIGCFVAVFLTIGFYFRLFAKMDSTKFKYTKVQLSQALYSSLANHYLDDWVGGRLYLLHDAIVFQTNLINATRRHELMIPLADVAQITIGDSKVVSTKITIANRNGGESVFFVNKASVWKEQVERQRTAG